MSESNITRKGQASGLSEEILKSVLPTERQREDLLHLLGHLNADDAAVIILKGHLVIEEKLNSVIEKFTFHPEHLEDARLTFEQKLSLCRSISLDRNNHSMWDVISKLNRLRNALSHSLDGDGRAKATESLVTAYANLYGGTLPALEQSSETELFTCVLCVCLGFIGAIEREVERFRKYVNKLDVVVNPHRHTKQKEDLPAN